MHRRHNRQRLHRDARPIFEFEERIGGGYWVRVTLPNSAPEQLSIFATEGEAVRWIKKESAAWLHSRSRRNEAVN
jgi:hypothetical protein